MMYLNSLMAALNKLPLNCKFNNVPSGIATDRRELSEAKCRLAGDGFFQATHGLTPSQAMS
jgi:hypothetical protein